MFLSYTLVAFLILLSGLFSGLNLGLMGLNAQELQRKAKLGNKNAKKIYPIRKEGNFLLVTLLLGNVAVNAAIAIVLGSITSGLVAGLISTALITVFGEIIPQATFSRYALEFGAKFVWIVKLFMYGLYPVTKPVAWLLDKLLGEELGTVYSRKELIEIIEEHKRSTDSDVGDEEERIIRGALTIAEKKVGDVMTPSPVLKMYSSSVKLNDELITDMINSGFSRFPVYKQKFDNIVGIVYFKNCIRKSGASKTVLSVASKEVMFVNEDMNLIHVFSSILENKHHMAIVRNKFGTVLGLITLEDVIEEIIQDEIVDESDAHIDLRKHSLNKGKKQR